MSKPNDILNQGDPMSQVKTIEWKDGAIVLPDQTLLPERLEMLRCEKIQQIWEAIKMLRVRGAPALGVAAAYAVVLGLKEFAGSAREEFDRQMNQVCDYIATSRPTAVNLFWALERMKRFRQTLAEQPTQVVWEALLEEARRIHQEDEQTCQAIGDHGQTLLPNPATVITHCNAGALATAGIGTALGVIYAAQQVGKKVRVYSDETRPLLQGARLTAWELIQNGVEVITICDNMAAVVLKTKSVDCVIVGADRIAANGDTANKIGTYGLSILAKHHGAPFYVAAPLSTIDRSLSNGAQIPIEERDPDEIRRGFGRLTAPPNVQVFNPAFDVTPAENVSAIITEKGILRAPYERSIAEAFKGRE